MEKNPKINKRPPLCEAPESNIPLTMFRMGFFGANHGWGMGDYLKSVIYVPQR